MNYALYDAAGNFLLKVAAYSLEDALSRYNRSLSPEWGGIPAETAVQLKDQYECWYCRDTGMVVSNLGGEQVETTCSYCVERQRLSHLEVEVADLRLIVDLLVDRLRQTMLADDLDNLPLPKLSRNTDEIPF